MPKQEHETILRKLQWFFGLFLAGLVHGLALSICLISDKSPYTPGNFFVPPILASFIGGFLFYKGRHLLNVQEPLLNNPWFGPAFIVWIAVFALTKIFVRF